MKRTLSAAIILSLVVGSMFSTVYAKNAGNLQTKPGKMNKKTTLPGKKANSSYHQICVDLLKKVEYKNKLTRVEKSIVNQYVSTGKVSSKKIHHLESAIKKHNCVAIKNPNKKKNLISSPKSHTVGKWYSYRCGGTNSKGTASTGNNAKSQNCGGSAK